MDVSTATIARALGSRVVQRVTAAGMADAATILRPTATPDGIGGETEGETAIATVPCSVGPMQATPAEPVWAEQIGTRAVYAIALPYGTVVQPRDRLLVNGTMRFEVVTMLHRTWRVAERVVCVKEKG